MNALKERTLQIAELNDAFRSTFRGGKVFLTAGVDALGLVAVLDIQMAVQQFNTFTVDNDPYREHDFGSLDYQGEKIFWKIDCYQNGSDYHAGPETPENASGSDFLSVSKAAMLET